MNPSNDLWNGGILDVFPPPLGIYQPSPLPPEFRRENEDLAIPRTDEGWDTLENYLIFRPFY